MRLKTAATVGRSYVLGVLYRKSFFAYSGTGLRIQIYQQYVSTQDALRLQREGSERDEYECWMLVHNFGWVVRLWQLGKKVRLQRRKRWMLDALT